MAPRESSQYKLTETARAGLASRGKPNRSYTSGDQVRALSLRSHSQMPMPCVANAFLSVAATAEPASVLQS